METGYTQSQLHDVTHRHVGPSRVSLTNIALGLTEHSSSDTCTTDQMRTGRPTGPYGYWRPPLETLETGEWRPRCQCHRNGTRCDLPALSLCYRNGIRCRRYVGLCTWCSPSCRCPCVHCSTWSDTGSDTGSDAWSIIIEPPAQPNEPDASHECDSQPAVQGSTASAIDEHHPTSDEDPGRHGMTISTIHGTANYNLSSDASPGDGIADCNVSSDPSSITQPQPLGVTNPTMVQPPQPLGVTNSSVSDSQQPASVTHTSTSAPSDRDSNAQAGCYSDGEPQRRGSTTTHYFVRQ